MAKDQGNNPLTGKPANSFTQVTNRALPPPTNVRDYALDKPMSRRESSARIRHQAEEKHLPEMGYRISQGQGAALDERYAGWFMRPSFPEQHTGPAIDEPHEAAPGVTVQRRAEDLSGREYAKGAAAFEQVGHPKGWAVQSLVDTTKAQIEKTATDHIKAGVNESASQMFYGGEPTTKIPDEALAEHHRAGVMDAYSRFETVAKNTGEHPRFESGGTPRVQASRMIAAQAVADTSPNAKFRTGGQKAAVSYPNADQAEESIRAGLEGRKPGFVTGRVDNHQKAADRAKEAVDTGDFDVSKYGDPKTSAKTVAFRGAYVDRNSPDAFNTFDIHDQGSKTPWVSTEKAHLHEVSDPTVSKGTKQVSVWANTPVPKGATPLYKETGAQGGAKKRIPKKGNAKVEAATASAQPYTHALADYATRKATSDLGLSRGVNYADNTHTAQAAVWGSQQLGRADVEIKASDQYPVARQWSQEGASVPESGHIRDLPTSGGINFSPQFARNKSRANRVDPQ